MNPILSVLLKESKQYIALFQKQWNNKALRGQCTPAQKEYFELLQQLIPDLEILSKKIDTNSSGATEFNGLYNKYFPYLDKFMSVQQYNISALLQNKRLVNKLQVLYSHIKPETIQRQGELLKGRKEAIDKWASKLSEQLQNEDTKVGLEKRFQELLEVANLTVAEKGMDNVPLT